jgi:hypothetical protein
VNADKLVHQSGLLPTVIHTTIFNHKATSATRPGTNFISGPSCTVHCTMYFPHRSFRLHVLYETGFTLVYLRSIIPYRNSPAAFAFYLSFVSTYYDSVSAPLICAHTYCKAAPCRRTIAAFPLTTDVYCSKKKEQNVPSIFLLHFPSLFLIAFPPCLF